MVKVEISEAALHAERTTVQERLYILREHVTMQFFEALKPRMAIHLSDEELKKQAQVVRHKDSTILREDIPEYIVNMLGTSLPGETPLSPYICIQGPLGSGKTTWFQQEVIPTLEYNRAGYTYVQIPNNTNADVTAFARVLRQELSESVSQRSENIKHIAILDGINALNWYEVDDIFWNELIASDELYGRVLWVFASEEDAPWIDFDFDKGKAEIRFDRFTMDETARQTQLYGKKLKFLYNLTHGMPEANAVIAPFLHAVSNDQLSEQVHKYNIARAIRNMLNSQLYLGQCTPRYRTLFYAGSLIETFDEYTMEAILPVVYPVQFSKKSFNSTQADYLLRQYEEKDLIVLDSSRVGLYKCDEAIGSLAQFVMMQLEKQKSKVLLARAIREFRDQIEWNSGKARTKRIKAIRRLEHLRMNL